eukprot:GDKI01021986.1.p1 GENE.GDKI01021986.1~~GDKI01021986.1.p1  ORF type:complete len:445 (+),score=93.03 GDKI01021986.1:126-1460(+)
MTTSAFHPRTLKISQAIKAESRLKKRAKHIGKRFRSWAQARMRLYRLNLPVTVTADPSLMDGQYIAACCQKAASLRKHDVGLWFGYSRRIMELAPTLTPEQLGYIFYGYGKSMFMHEQLYRALLPHVTRQLKDFYSHSLMCVMWACHRVKIKDEQAMQAIAHALVEKMDNMRPRDMIKICNVYAKMGLRDPTLTTSLSPLIINKLESIFAQEFRNVMCDVAICNLYSDELKKYIMSRFTKIFICARPQHYMQAYKTAVAIRVLHPHVWDSLGKQVRSFYVRLSMRRLTDRPRFPSRFHWDVSNTLAKVGIAHRNTFKWGCYWLDIGEAHNKKNAWMVDGPSAFYASTNQYTEQKKLDHRVLSDLGWSIRRVRWDEWVECGDDREKKMALIRKIRDAPPLPNELIDKPLVAPETIKEKLALVKQIQRQRKERIEQKKKASIEFAF